MNRATVHENGEVKETGHIKQEAISYGYDSSYINYSSSTPTSLNQPLPGQPPLPPMPPPQGAVPPPPSMFAPVPAQVTQMAWPSHPWQWITSQPGPPALPHQTPRDLANAAAAAAAYQREMPLRNNYIKRERYNNNRNNMYQQRGNFYRKNKRAQQRYEQNQANNAHQYFEALMTHVPLPMQHSIPLMAASQNTMKTEEPSDQDIKEEVVIKKNKQRKPMSQSYPSRPWNREDAEKALTVENEYTRSVKAKSLIIKFPDPDLNKDIVRKFHPGIQNIHFQSPSGPRFCFVQMGEDVDIEQAIKDLQNTPFGVGHLKVERKSLREEDAPKPEEIDPYTLYIGNLPESVNVNEVKSKFPLASRVDVGYAQKMRNTRYAFIRYNSVEESITAYKEAHNLMWDTRSIIVRFRRQRGNTCLPGEPKANPKKIKEETTKGSTSDNAEPNENKSKVKKETNHITSLNNTEFKSETIKEEDEVKALTSTESSAAVTSSDALTSNSEKPEKQSMFTQSLRLRPISKSLSEESTQEEDDTLLTEIKEEPADYDEIKEESADYDEINEEMNEVSEINEMSMNEDDIDDDEDLFADEPDVGNGIMEYEEDFLTKSPEDPRKSKTAPASDSLDKMFDDLENIAGDIDL